MWYDVGDKVKVRLDLEENYQYGSDVCVSNMLAYTGQEATITKVIPWRSGFEYSIDLDNGYWTWTEQMFEKEGK